MRKLKLRYIIISLVLFAGLIVVRHYSPRPVDWKMTFSYNQEAPYGCFVLDKMFPHLFHQEIFYNYASLYKNPLLSTGEEKNIIIVTSAFDPGEADLISLFDHVRKGSRAFIAAHDFPENFLDSLRVSLNKRIIDTTFWKPENDVLNFYNPQLRKDSGYVMRSMMIKPALEPDKDFRGSLLGYGPSAQPNYIKCQWGKGYFYIHSNPLAFTNLQILYGDREYVKNALSYLPDRELVIDRYYKPFRAVNNSPAKFILSHPPLQTAYYLILLALLLYMIFGSRRKQKIIPVIEPLKNTSVEFIKTIARLYFRTNDHGNIVHKKTIYFKEFLRENYFIIDITEDEEDVRMIRSKTGVPEPLVRKVVRKVNYYEKPRPVSQEALMAYHRDLEEFKRNCL